MSERKSISLEISGFGLIFYSPFAVSGFSEGRDYFALEFEDPYKVERRAKEGGVVALNLGTPGAFVLNVLDGYPSDEVLRNNSIRMRLGIEVRDDLLCVRDLFDLIGWESEVPFGQTLILPSGFYHMTLLTEIPPSGIRGDNQTVYLYLQQLDCMPLLKFEGVPMLV